ncbi:MAG TPA: nucleotidyltransferase family protein [Terriglobia bacterium]|nr:nucleotidyltransferase family protein [Terriglobia bacterium]
MRALREAILHELSVTRNELHSGTPWRAFAPGDWEAAFTWLDLSGLAIYFLHRMKGPRAVDMLPESVLSDLERRRADNRLRTERILSEFGAFTRAFDQRNVKYAVLKGVSLLPDYCPEMSLRTQYDHDVLVAPDSLDAARRALEDAGFRPKAEKGAEAPLVYRKSEPAMRFSRNSEALYSPLLGRSVELHRTLWEGDEERIDMTLSDDFLERSRRRQWEAISFMALCDEDCLLFQVLHAFKHILRNWCRLSIFLEIAWFLNHRSGDSAFWERFRNRIENVRWAREATLVVFTLAEQLFGGVCPSQMRNVLKSPVSPALCLWIERYGRRSAISNFHADKSSLFLHREFVDHPADWAAIRRRRLFPMHRPHRPPAVVFQRGFSAIGRIWMEKLHALRRLRFHGIAGLRYVFEYPRWMFLRRLRLAGSGRL